jgi:hypothetical protein
VRTLGAGRPHSFGPMIFQHKHASSRSATVSRISATTPLNEVPSQGIRLHPTRICAPPHSPPQSATRVYITRDSSPILLQYGIIPIALVPIKTAFKYESSSNITSPFFLKPHTIVQSPHTTVMMATIIQRSPTMGPLTCWICCQCGHQRAPPYIQATEHSNQNNIDIKHHHGGPRHLPNNHG